MSAVILPMRRSKLPREILVPVLLAALLLSSVITIGIGPVALPVADVWATLLAPITGNEPALRDQALVWQLRMPRILLAILCGSVLALAGASLQGLFRNPLADPGLIGVSSGAALAAGSVIVFVGMNAPAWLLPLAAFSGGLATVTLVARIARIGSVTSVATLLLAGVAMTAIGAAGLGMLSFLADDFALRNLTFWTLGSLGRATWQDLGPAAPMLALACLVMLRLARPLNALLLGEAEARHLGVDVERVKKQLLIWSTLGVGAAVALTGIIGFVGLIIPHLIRLLVGPDHRILMPASACGGALLLLWTDALSRTVVAPAELPIGIVTSLIGGPFFIWLLLQNRQRLFG
ncbi:MAG: FecCD family ABC transporter permease [Nevskiales bacterium]